MKELVMWQKGTAVASLAVLFLLLLLIAQCVRNEDVRYSIRMCATFIFGLMIVVLLH
jgi:uncharacterized membrane protein